MTQIKNLAQVMIKAGVPNTHAVAIRLCVEHLAENMTEEFIDDYGTFMQDVVLELVEEV